MTQRYHAMDSLRAIIMWLGIIVHVAINHMAGDNIIPWRDSQTGPLADLLVIFIHTFRMPVFFILAGFFGAMLLHKFGTKGMLINRAKRLALPFVLFWPLLLVSLTILGMLFFDKMGLGDGHVTPTTVLEHHDRPLLNTLHLWFLYYLIWFFIFATFIHTISRYISIPIRTKVVALFSTLATHWWGLIVLTLPLVFAGLFYEFGLITPDGSLFPNIWEIIHNGSFFVFGWFFFLTKEHLILHFQRYCWGYAISGTVAFFVVLVEFGMVEQGKMNTEYARAIIAFSYNFVSWLWSLSLIGIFLRYLPKQNAALRYLSESSYWVYLVHMIGTIGFGILLYDTTLSLIPKMLVNLILTTLACLISYHFLVRNTWIGLLLNGRKYSRQNSINSTRYAVGDQYTQPD